MAYERKTWEEDAAILGETQKQPAEKASQSSTLDGEPVLARHEELPNESAVVDDDAGHEDTPMTGAGEGAARSREEAVV